MTHWIFYVPLQPLEIWMVLRFERKCHISIIRTIACAGQPIFSNFLDAIFTLTEGTLSAEYPEGMNDGWMKVRNGGIGSV